MCITSSGGVAERAIIMPGLKESFHRPLAEQMRAWACVQRVRPRLCSLLEVCILSSWDGSCVPAASHGNDSSGGSGTSGEVQNTQGHGFWRRMSRTSSWP
jgi:hypothetical protein